MATAEQIASLRGMINEPTETPYTDISLGIRIDAEPSLEAVAANIWREKAARYSELVDVQEGNSRRNLGDLYEQALAMADQYAAAGAVIAPVRRGSKTRRIERA